MIAVAVCDLPILISLTSGLAMLSLKIMDNLARLQ